MPWHYSHFSAPKSGGTVSKAVHLDTVEKVEDFVNTFGPERDGIQCILSEGSTSRDFYCWVRDDHAGHKYDLTSVVWKGNTTVDTIIELLENDAQRVVLCGFDGGKTQSIHYFRKI